MSDQVVLVDADDRQVGLMEKLQAHHEGRLHRAFSILLFNKRGELLLQQRALHKYHSGGIWSNTCCSHPKPGEKVLTAAHRRLKEEMGIETSLKQTFHFIYKAQIGTDLIEHELDHVLVGSFSGTPAINDHEVKAWRYISMDTLRKEIHKNPAEYTYWLRRILHHPKLKR